MEEAVQKQKPAKRNREHVIALAKKAREVSFFLPFTSDKQTEITVRVRSLH